MIPHVLWICLAQTVRISGKVAKIPSRRNFSVAGSVITRLRRVGTFVTRRLLPLVKTRLLPVRHKLLRLSQTVTNCHKLKKVAKSCSDG